ncbi:MAG: MFS transporter [Nocardioidaceae bacterium]
MQMTPAQRGTMVAVVLGSGIVFLDSAVVNLALPRIAAELPSSLFAPLEAQSYVVNAYFVTLSALLILAGALTDLYGRRRVFILGLTAFAVTSLLCALAPTMELLIAFRVLQGAAGAARRTRLARDHHGRVHGGAAGQSVRPLGGRLGSHDNSGTVRRRGARQCLLVAAGLCCEPAVPRRCRLGDHALRDRV